MRAGPPPARRRPPGPHNSPVRMEGEGFETGDVVRLKSGGPAMVVRAVSGDTAYCQWFDGLQLHQGTFLFTSLRDIGQERRTPEAPQPPSP